MKTKINLKMAPTYSNRIGNFVVLMFETFPATAGPLETAMCDGGACTGHSVSFVDYIVGFVLLFFWFSYSIKNRTSRIMFSGIIGSIGLWGASNDKLLGWFFLLVVIFLWVLRYPKGKANDCVDSAITRPNIKDGIIQNETERSNHTASHPPSGISHPSSPIFLDVPWAENEFQAKKYRKLIACGYRFAREDNKIVAIVPGGKRQAIYTSFDLDDLVEAVEELHNKKVVDTAAQASLVFDANIELAKKISDRRIAILIIQQWEDGPWMAGAYRARDAVIAYINTASPSVSYTSEDEAINAAVAHSETLFSTLYESGVEPLDSETGSDKLVAAEILVARMKKRILSNQAGNKEVAN